jgi:zinc protease
MASVERTDVDGIPVFWAPAPGAFRAALLFRVGVADETPATRGITHLVEHLAMFGSESSAYESNGFVDLQRSVFYGSGDRDDVLGWLRRCAAALADLPLGRLATERRILRTEEAGGGGGGVQARLLDLRFGGNGYGLSNFREVGLRWLAEDDVAEWARSRFNRGNAAVWMTGEPPDSLEFALPDGSRNPPPALDPLPMKAERVFLADGTGGLAVSGLGKRSTPLHSSLTVAHERLYRRLRLDLGLVYDPWSNYEPLGVDFVHVLMGAECPDDRAERVAGEVWRVVEEIADKGLTAEEIAEHRKRSARMYAEPDGVLSELDHAASQTLLGGEPIDTDEVLRELEELTPADTAAAVAEAFEHAFYLVPGGIEQVEGFARYEPVRPDPVDGTAYTYDTDFVPAGFELRVGDSGLTLIRPDDKPLTLLWEELVLGETAPAGALMLMARDGSWVELPFATMESDEAREAVVKRLPDGIMVPAGNLEATEALQDLGAQLPDEAHVAPELAALPKELGEDETPEAVMAYRHGDGRGLLALTSERLIRWYLDADDSDGEAIPREAIKGAEVRKRRLRPTTLVIEHEQELEVKVDDVDAAEDLASRLRPT